MAASCKPAIVAFAPNRFLPQQYHEQALASLRETHPRLHVVVDRPFETMPSIHFDLIVYRDAEEPGMVRATGSAVTVLNEYAWRFDLACRNGDFLNGLIATIAQLSRLVAPIVAPLRAEELVSGRFVVYSRLAQADVPGGDPVIFLSDGTVANAHAGLVGRWSVIDDSTLAIGSVTFHLRKDVGDLVAPWPLDTLHRAALYRIERDGTSQRNPPR